MNSSDENEPRNQLYVNEEGSFTSKGIAQISGKGKLLRTSPKEMEAKRQKILENIQVPLLLVTVQHTASRFFVNLLQEHYGPPWPIHAPGCPFYFEHCRNRTMDSIKARHNEGAMLITTERPWGDCQLSWAKRGVQPLDEFDEQVSNWYSWVEPNSAVILNPWKESMRDSDLATLSVLIGKDLETDWRPMG